MQFNYRSYLGYRGYYGCNVLSQINKNKEKFAEEPSFFERLQVFLFGQQKPIENDDDIVESNSA